MKKFLTWGLFPVFTLLSFVFALKACSSASMRSTGVIQRYPGSVHSSGGAPATPSQSDAPAIITAIGSAIAAILSIYYGRKSDSAAAPNNHEDDTGERHPRKPRWYRELHPDDEPGPQDIVVYIRSNGRRLRRIYCEPRYDEAP